MKSVFYLGLAFLFSFSSGAVENYKDSCSAMFEDLGSNQVSESSFSSQKIKAQQKKTLNRQEAVSFIDSTDSIGQLDKKWKDQVLESLPYLDSREFFSLLYKLAVLHNKLDLNHEKSFFKSLEQASINHIAEFNKEQLLSLLWIFIKLDMKHPTETFVQAWREAAYQKRREFTPLDKYGTRGFFKQLEVPLSSPLFHKQN